MAVFIDTGIFFAAKNADDVHHLEAVAILQRIFSKELGAAYTSDYIVDELVSVTYSRTKRREKSTQALMECIESPELFTILNVNEDEFNQSAHEYVHVDELSFTDCSILTQMRKHGIKNLATFDSGFRQAKGIHIINA